MAIKKTKKGPVKAATEKARPVDSRKRAIRTASAKLTTDVLVQTIPAQATAGSLSVLVIDEDYFTRSVYESELHQQNIEVVTVADGLLGLEEARRRRPCIIVLELILPKLNGFELIKIIKQDPSLKNTVLVVASILGQVADREEAMRLGADKYLSKNDYSAKQIITEVVNLMSAQL